MQYKAQLHSTKKRVLSMSPFLLKIKTLADSLAAIGQPLSVNDHLNFIFNGLPYEYDAFVCSILTRVDQYKIPDVEALLLAQESRLQLSKSTDITTANVAQTSVQNNGGRGNQSTGRGRGAQNFGG